MTASNHRGNRLGPYQLESRYRGTGEDLGRVYRARHAETGAPALVVQHTERHPEDAPLADWALRLRSSTSPAYLALEVESAPQTADSAAAGEELDYMLDDLHSAVDRTLRRPEVLRHLRSPRRPPAQPQRDWRPGLFAGALAAALAVTIVHSTPTHAPGFDDSLRRAQLAPAALDAGWVAGDVTGLALTGTAGSEPIALARPMPRQPFKGLQKLPPCDPVLEEEHFGGCWVPHRTRAPCPDKLYELGDQCYLPAVAAPPKPTSIFR